MTSLTFADLGSAGRQKQGGMMSLWPAAAVQMCEYTTNTQALQLGRLQAHIFFFGF